MQSTVDLQLTDANLEELRAGKSFLEVLLEVLMENREKIGYSLQDYHAREKVRVVDFTEISATGDNNYRATVRYSLEQFSVCAAMDSTDYTSMALTLRYNDSLRTLQVTGEYTPEA
jgi:hypothetical protein